VGVCAWGGGVFSCLDQNSVCLHNYGRNACCKDLQQRGAFFKTIFAQKKILFPLNHIVLEV
jgi:hypothetical protein